MAAPQKENGYTPIANEILEAIYKAKYLSATQCRILMIIWRYTYGFSRKNAPIAQSFIAEATGTHISSVRREMKKLIEWGIVREISPATFNRARILEFNKNYEEWKPAQVAQELPPGTDAGRERARADTGSVDATLIKQDKAILQIQRAYAKFYSENIGVLTGFISQEAESFIEDGLSDEMILFALKLAVERNARNWKYAKSILNRWLENGINTLQKAEAEQTEFKNRKCRGKPKDVAERTYTPEEKKQREIDAFAEMERLWEEDDHA